MIRVLRTILICMLTVLAACSEEVPPVSVIEFMENPRVLEAAMVRCGQNRSETKYEADCVNAREAVNRLASVEREERRQRLEEQSQRKRQALRRTQEAAAEARRRALEAQRLREEAEYLGLFETTPTEQTAGQNLPSRNVTTQNAPTQNVPAQNGPSQNVPTQNVQGTLQPQTVPAAPAGDRVGGNDPSQAPTAAETVPVTEDENLQSDLASIREELQRRRDNPE